jgi:hypothetical protein
MTNFWKKIPYQSSFEKKCLLLKSGFVAEACFGKSARKKEKKL